MALDPNLLSEMDSLFAEPKDVTTNPLFDEMDSLLAPTKKQTSKKEDNWNLMDTILGIPKTGMEKLGELESKVLPNSVFRGLAKLTSNVKEGVPAIVGSDEAAKKLEEFNAFTNKQYPTEADQPIKSFSDALKATPDMLGEALPALVGTVATGGAAGLPAAAAVLYPQVAAPNLEKFGTENRVASNLVSIPETALNLFGPSRILTSAAKPAQSVFTTAVKKGLDAAAANAVGGQASNAVYLGAQNYLLDKPILTPENGYAAGSQLLSDLVLGGVMGSGVGAHEQARTNRSGLEVSTPDVSTLKENTPEDSIQQAKDTLTVDEGEKISRTPPKPEEVPIDEMDAELAAPEKVADVDVLEKAGTDEPLTRLEEESQLPKEQLEPVSDPLEDVADLTDPNKVQTRIDKQLAADFEPIKIQPKFNDVNPNSTLGTTINNLRSIDEAGQGKPPAQKALNSLALVHGALKVNDADPSIASAAQSLAVKALASPESPIKFDFGDTLKEDSRQPLIDYIHKTTLQPVDWFSHRSSESLMGEAYSLYKNNEDLPRKQNINEKYLPSVFKSKFKELDNTLNKYGNQLRENGISNMKDLFQNDQVLDPDQKNTGLESSLANSLLLVEQQKQAIQNREAAKQLAVSNAETFKFNKDRPIAANVFLADLPYLKDVDPAFGKVHNIIQDRHADARMIRNQATEKLAPIHQKYGRDEFNDLGNILEQNRLKGFKGHLDKEGRFVYKDKSGHEQRLEDRTKSQELVDMQESMQNLLDTEKASVFLQPDVANMSKRLGLPLIPSIKDIEAALSRKGITKTQKNQLEHLQKLSGVLDRLSDTDYLPFSREGEFAVKGTKEGQPDALLTFNSADGGRTPAKDRAYENFASWQKELKEKGYSFTPSFKLTSDKQFQELQKMGSPSEIVDSILNRKSDNPGQKDAASDKLLEEIYDRLVRKSNRNFDPSKNVLGYNRDWHNIVPRHIGNMSYYYANRINAPRLAEVRRNVEKGGWPSKSSLYKELGRQIEYNTSYDPEKLNNFIKEMNFAFGLAFNPSTAALQPFAIAQTIFPQMVELTGSFTKAAYHTAKGFKEAASLIPKSPKNFASSAVKGDTLSGESILKNMRSKGYSEEKIARMQALLEQGVIVDSFGGDIQKGKIPLKELGRRVSDKEIKEAAKGTWQNVLHYGSLGMRLFEGYTRLGHALALESALDSPKTLAKEHRRMKQYSQAYKENMKSRNSDQPDKAFMSAWNIGKALAEFGKEGTPGFARGKIGPIGNIFAPYAKYNYQVNLENFLRRFGTGPDGLKANLAFTATQLLMSGLKGVPFVSAIWMATEAAYKAIYGEDFDLMTELYKLMDTTYEEDRDEITAAGMANHGLLSEATNIDLGRRLGSSLPGEPAMEYMMKSLTGDTKNLPPISSLASPVGAIPQALGKIGGALTNGDNAAAEAGKALMPSAVGNVIKANVTEPNEGKSFKGQYILTPEEANKPSSRFLHSLGLRYLEEQEQRDQIAAEERLNKPFEAKQSRFKNQLKNLYVSLETATSRNKVDDMNRIQNDIDKKQEDIINYAESKSLPVNWVKGVMEAADIEGQASGDKEFSRMMRLKKFSKQGRQRVFELEGE